MPVLEERRNFSRMERKITENSRLKKGFTLAELLIVVAIIAVLVAIGIPIFTSQLEKSREAVDLSEVRSAYAEVMMAALTGDTNATYTKDGSEIYLSSGDYQITVQPLKQKQDGWQTKTPLNIGGVSSEAGQPYWIGVPVANGYCKITYHAADDYVSFEWSGAADSGNKGDNSSKGDSGTSTVPDQKYDWNAREWDKNSDIKCKIGDVFTYNGTYYIALTDRYVAGSNPGKGGWHEYSLITPNGTIYTSKDANENGKLDRKINYGDMYMTENGTMYICKGGSDGGLMIPSEENKGNWVKINTNSQSEFGK